MNQGTNTITVTESNGNWVSSGAWNTVTGQGNATAINNYLSGDEVQGITVNPDDIRMTCTYSLVQVQLMVHQPGRLLLMMILTS